MTCVFVTSGKKIGIARTRTCRVYVFGPRQWDDAEWDELVEEAARQMNEETLPRALTYSSTATPSAAQRRRLVERIEAGRTAQAGTAVILSASAAVRVAATGLGVLLKLAKSKRELLVYHPRDIEKALDKLGFAAGDPERKEVRDTLAKALPKVGYSSGDGVAAG